MNTIDLRKYAILTWALSLARGALYSAKFGDLESIDDAIEKTSLRSLAERFGYQEADLVIDWKEHLDV